MDILLIKDPGHADSGNSPAAGDGRLLTELQGTLEQLRAALHSLILVRSRSKVSQRAALCAQPGAAGGGEPLLPATASAAQSMLPHHLCPRVQESRSNRKESRQWLVNSMAGLDLGDAATKRRRFAQFLPGGAACRGAEHRQVAEGMLQLLFEAAPAEVGACASWGRRGLIGQFRMLSGVPAGSFEDCASVCCRAPAIAVLGLGRGLVDKLYSGTLPAQVGTLIAQDASLLRHFFKSDPKRVPLWFGHFRWVAASCQRSLARGCMLMLCGTKELGLMLTHGQHGAPAELALHATDCRAGMNPLLSHSPLFPPPAAWRACGGSSTARPRWRSTPWPTEQRCDAI